MAAGAYRRSLDHDPSASALAGLANAERLLGRDAEAVEHARRALGLDPHDVEARLQLAAALRASPDRALDALEPLLARSPPVRAAWDLLGGIAADRGLRVRLTRVPLDEIELRVGDAPPLRCGRDELPRLLALVRGAPRSAGDAAPEP